MNNHNLPRCEGCPTDPTKVSEYLGVVLGRNCSGPSTVNTLGEEKTVIITEHSGSNVTSVRTEVIVVSEQEIGKPSCSNPVLKRALNALTGLGQEQVSDK